MAFSRILAHDFNGLKRPKIWSNEALLAGQIRAKLEDFEWSNMSWKLDKT